METILFSSTRQWNPGDEFIFFGIRRLLEHLIGQRTNWLLWNRNPDLFINRWNDAHFRPGLLTNSLQTPDLDIVSAVLFAGTPEWRGDSVEPLYRELSRRPELPVLLIGIGSGGPGTRLRPYELQVLLRDNTLIVTRSSELANELNSALGRKKAVALPCPGLFTASREAWAPSLNGPVGLIVQNSAVENQRVSKEMVKELLFHFRYRGDVELVTFYIDEFRFYVRQGLFPRYSYDPHDYLRVGGILRDYRYVISSRLHGALAALSLGIPTSLVANGNYRITSTAALYRPVLPSGSFAGQFARISTMKEEELVCRSTNALRFRDETWDAYVALLDGFLGSLR